jgi:hypothetical protein
MERCFELRPILFDPSLSPARDLPSVCRSSHFLRFLTQHLTQTPSCGPTGPIGRNVPLLSPSTPFRLTLTKFSDFQYMTGSTTGASNRFYENIEKLAIATLKSPHGVTVRPV